MRIKRNIAKTLIENNTKMHHFTVPLRSDFETVREKFATYLHNDNISSNKPTLKKSFADSQFR